MSVTTSTLGTNQPVVLSQLMGRARELAGVPAIRGITDREVHRRRRAKADKDREIQLRQEWNEAEARRIERERQEEEQARDEWTWFLVMVFLIAMLRNTPQYQPEMSF